VVELDTGDAKPIHVRQYPVPHRNKSIVDDQVRKWLEEGIIQRHEGGHEWNLSLIIVRKQDVSGKQSGWRVCLDPRKINLLIPSCNYPLPLIHDILNSLKGSIVFSKIDLTSGFLQFILHRLDRKKAVFTLQGVPYEFIGTPFGFKHVPSVFQRVMAKIFRDMPFVLV
jgi:hypothetical protein